MKYSVKVSNDAVLKALFSIAKDSGVKVCSIYEEERTQWPHFTLDTEDGQVLGSRYEYTPITFEEMVEKIANFKTATVLQLTDKYDAIINYSERVVEVGCQVIPFDKVKEVREKIKDK